MHISAIIPVYNNETTVARLVRELGRHPDITEVIAVDDGSSDGSVEILSTIADIRVISHPLNRGKGAAIVSGWRAARYDTLLTIDADLAGFSARHVDELIDTFARGAWDMVISVDGHPLFHWVSGQRIYRKGAVMPYAQLAALVGNGIEQVVNYAHRNKRVQMIHTDDIGHVLKYHRHAPHEAAWLYAKEGWQLARTEYLLRRSDIASLPFARMALVGLGMLREFTKLR